MLNKSKDKRTPAMAQAGIYMGKGKSISVADGF